MKRTRVLTNYVIRLEKEEDKLREKILIPSHMLDGEVLWAFPGGIDFDNKNEVEEFLSFIIDVKVDPLAEIGESFRVAKTDIDDLLKEIDNIDYTGLSEKDRRISRALGKVIREDKKKSVEEWLERCLKKTKLPREKFIAKYEEKYNHLMYEYEAIIELLKMLKE